MAQKIDPKTLFKNKDMVSVDRNWTIRVNNELGSQQKWDNQWGFYAGGYSPQKIQKKVTLDDRIKKIQQQVKEIDTDLYGTSSGSYGKGTNVEIFQNNKYNKSEDHGIRPLERKLPKGWKKSKWTPPVDPFDPLSKKK